MKTGINDITKKIVQLNQTVLNSLAGASSLDIIKNFTEIGINILEADFGFAWWRFKNDEEYKLAYKSSTTPYEPTYPRKDAGNDIARSTKKPFFDSDVTKSKYAPVISKNLKSYVIIPISHKDIIYGSLVFCYKKHHEFTEDEVGLSTVLGTTAAQTLTINKLVKSEHHARLQSERHGAYFRALIENSDEAIFLVDKDGEIIYASPSIENIFGYIPEDVIGKRISDFIYRDNPERVMEFLEKVTQHSESTHEADFEYTDKDGVIRTMEAKAMNMLKNENVGGVVLNVRDITERKKAETLRETEMLLNEEKLKTEFIANATHEFRTPLAIIKGNVELALRLKPKDIKPVKAELKAINEEINHLSSLISDLALLTYKTKALQSMIGDKKLDLTVLIGDIVSRYQVIASQKDISIRTKWKGPVCVRGDEMYLNKLFLNLIKNAVSYGKEGGWVSIEITCNSKDAEIRVKDDGVGISREDLPYVFDRFFRVEKSRTGVEGGTGLGLAIVKYAVLAHGGNIRVDSKVGKGTTFIITLPRLK